MHIQTRNADHHDLEMLQCIGIDVWTETYAERGLSTEIARYVSQKFSRPSIESLLTDPGTLVQVASIADHVVGYGVRRENSPCPADNKLKSELATLYVLRRFQGAGVGRSLLASLRNPKSPNQTASSLWLRMNSKNQKAFTFYMASGFQKIGSIWVDFDGERNENYLLAASDASEETQRSAK
jgi:ribosomal protein S18 acetylase RimI-like enzyme